MRIAIKGGALLAALVLMLAPARVAHAQLTTEAVEGFAGVTTVDAVPSRPSPAPGLANLVVYNNTTSPANFGFASTDLAAIWGDELFTIGTGFLSQQQFTIFNSSSSLGPLLTATIGVQLYDGVSSSLVGSYSVNVNFGAGLNPGFFSIVNVTNLDPLNIGLNTTDVIVLQQILARTGTASRLGIVSMDPPTVGSSPATMYIAASTVNGGLPGFYTIAQGPANPGYLLSLAPPPVGTLSRSWGQIKQLYR